MTTERVYTLWASMRDTDPSPWMIAAEDEYSWEGDPSRCEAVFRDARARAERNGWDVREIVLDVDVDAVVGAFGPTKADVVVRVTEASE